MKTPCHAIVEALAKKLEELLAGRRILPPGKRRTTELLM